MNFRNKTEEFIYHDDLSWFEKYKPHLARTDRVLKIGAGLGFSAFFLSEYLKGELTVVEIGNHLHPDVAIPLTLYDGKRLPFADEQFDAVILSQVLHHCDDSSALLKEAKRVSTGKLIIIEEGWKNLFQRLSIIFNCWWVNRKILGKVKIHPKSYLGYKQWLSLFADNGLRVVESSFVRRNWRQRVMPYNVYLFILGKS